MSSVGPALQYLAGEISVEADTVMPLVASHNTVRMRFEVERAEYLHLAKPDASFPALHLSMLADHKRNQVKADNSCTGLFLGGQVVMHVKTLCTYWLQNLLKFSA